MIILVPVKNKLIEKIMEIKPIDWRNKSETKLPPKPRISLISVFLGKINYGSSGE